MAARMKGYVRLSGRELLRILLSDVTCTGLQSWVLRNATEYHDK